MHCRRFLPPPVSRRQMLAQCANGFGLVALGALLADPASGFARGGPLAPRAPHHWPRARNVIFLYMDGGPSQVDTWDPKPRLAKEHGQRFKMRIRQTQFDDVGRVLQSPWRFRRWGESGIPVSELFPHLARCVDKLLVVRSMTSDFSEHTNANYFLHTGFGLQGRPSMGAWLTYGLGTLAADLPGFVVLSCGMIPPGGLDCFGSGFLPATYQGSVFQPGREPLANIRPGGGSLARQRRKLRLLQTLDEHARRKLGPQDALEAAIANYELAFRMQTAVPEVADISGESRATCRLYGLESRFAPTRLYARQLLVARRLIERGVRFVEVLCPSVGADRWDQHNKLRQGHQRNALAVDQPIAGLLRDLESRGLLDETLVVWAGEFGRTPFAQGSDGRDHNPFGFSIWLAGGGVRAGTVFGATDEYGYYAVEDKVDIHDLHATMLHLLGVDHKRLTFRFSGRDMRLTDVHGRVIEGWLA